MTIYNSTLRLYANVYKRTENALIQFAVNMGFDDAIGKLRDARAAAMAERVELLIKNIKACKTYEHLKSSRDYYMILQAQYPEMTTTYSRIIGEAFQRAETRINNK